MLSNELPDDVLTSNVTLQSNLIGNTPIPSSLGTTITGAISSLDEVESGVEVEISDITSIGDISKSYVIKNTGKYFVWLRNNIAATNMMGTAFIYVNNVVKLSSNAIAGGVITLGVLDLQVNDTIKYVLSKCTAGATYQSHGAIFLG